MTGQHIQSAEEALREQKLKEIQESMNFAHDSLVSSHPKARLPEPVFITYFLPFFSGQPQPPGRNVVAEWIGVAGTPMSEVDVIDGNNNVIFTVPAIFNTSILEIANRKAGQSLADIYNEYELRKAGVPIAANGYLVQNLNNKAHEIVRGPQDMNSVSARWAQILGRYGIATSLPGAATPAAQQNTGGDDLVYD